MNPELAIIGYIATSTALLSLTLNAFVLTCLLGNINLIYRCRLQYYVVFIGAKVLSGLATTILNLVLFGKSGTLCARELIYIITCAERTGDSVSNFSILMITLDQLFFVIMPVKYSQLNHQLFSGVFFTICIIWTISDLFFLGIIQDFQLKVTNCLSSELYDTAYTVYQLVTCVAVACLVIAIQGTMIIKLTLCNRSRKNNSKKPLCKELKETRQLSFWISVSVICFKLVPAFIHGTNFSRKSVIPLPWLALGSDGAGIAEAATFCFLHSEIRRSMRLFYLPCFGNICPMQFPSFQRKRSINHIRIPVHMSGIRNIVS